MAVYTRPDSVFYWMALERPGLRALRQSTGVPIAADTAEQRKAQRQLAQQVYLAAMGDLVRKRHEIEPERETITFRHYAAWYLEHVSPTKRNLARERSMMKPLVEYLGPIYLHELERRHAIEFRTWRRKRVSAGTVNREMILAKAVLTSAVPKYLSVSPFAKLSDLAVEDLDIRILDFDEEERIYSVADAEDAALIMTALDTLMRLTSVAGVKRAQDHKSYFTVLNPKTTTYKVPISSRARARIDALPMAGSFIFPRYNSPGIGEAGRRNRVIRNFAEICARADVPYGRKVGGVTFHSLRHTGASRMLAAGVDIKTVMLLGGWTNLNVLERYLHPTDEVRRRAVEMISVRQVHEVVGVPAA